MSDKNVTDTKFAENVGMNVDVVASAQLNPVSRVEQKMAKDEAFRQEAIYLAKTVPDARGLEEIHDPFLKAKVADALDVGRDPAAMMRLAKVLELRYPQAAEKVRKQARYLASMPRGL